MPDNQFSGTSSSNNDAKSLVSVKLPSNLNTIGRSAFYGQTSLKEVFLPDGLINLGNSAFYNCRNLESIHQEVLPDGVKEIPGSCFYYCEKLQPFTIPEGVESIGSNTFNHCLLFKSSLPSTLKKIGSQAFTRAGMDDVDITISEGTECDGSVFASTKIKSIKFPTTFYKAPNKIIAECKNLTDVYLISPTVLSWSSGNDGFLEDCTNPNLKVHVPAHLLEAYKLNSYFKDFTIVGDATDDYTGWWSVNAPLNLSYNRMPASSNIILNNNVTLGVKGNEAQIFGNVITYGHTSVNNTNSKYAHEDWSMIINTSDKVTISGSYEHKIETYEKRWYFFSLPFDFKVSDITTEGNVKYAIRYYDGASRATGNSDSGNWKDYAEDAIVKAGTGFSNR